MSAWFGFAWWAVLGAAAAGLVLAIASRASTVVRMLGCAGVVAVIAFVVQPQLLMLGGAPAFIGPNLRYAVAGLALGLVLLPLSPLSSNRLSRWLVPAGFLVIVVVMQLDPALWPTDLRDLRYEDPVHGFELVAGVVTGAITLAVGLGLVHRSGRLEHAPDVGTSQEPSDLPHGFGARKSVLAFVTAAVALVGIVTIDRWYLSSRYAQPRAETTWLDEHWMSWEWARDLEDARVAVGRSNLLYPLYGNDLSNVVEPIPNEFVAQGGSLPKNTPAACERFVRWINENRFTYVVLYGAMTPTQHFLPPPDLTASTPQVLWLDAHPAAARLLREPLEAVYRIDGELNPATCHRDTR